MFKSCVLVSVIPMSSRLLSPSLDGVTRVADRLTQDSVRNRKEDTLLTPVNPPCGVRACVRVEGRAGDGCQSSISSSNQTNFASTFLVRMWNVSVGTCYWPRQGTTSCEILHHQTLTPYPVLSKSRVFFAAKAVKTNMKLIHLYEELP